jgi:hypothetical protein
VAVLVGTVEGEEFLVGLVGCQLAILGRRENGRQFEELIVALVNPGHLPVTSPGVAKLCGEGCRVG